jgi:hypothetical protein
MPRPTNRAWAFGCIVKFSSSRACLPRGVLASIRSHAKSVERNSRRQDCNSRSLSSRTASFSAASFRTRRQGAPPLFRSLKMSANSVTEKPIGQSGPDHSHSSETVGRKHPVTGGSSGGWKQEIPPFVKTNRVRNTGVELWNPWNSRDQAKAWNWFQGQANFQAYFRFDSKNSSAAR